MYHRLTDERKETSEGNAKESDRVLNAATPGNYGSTPLQDKTNTQSYVPYCGLILCIMTFFGIFCAFALRTALSEAIVAMVNYTAVAKSDISINVSSDSQCPRDEETESARHGGELNWSRQQQAIVLAAFYYGTYLLWYAVFYLNKVS